MVLAIPIMVLAILIMDWAGEIGILIGGLITIGTMLIMDGVLLLFILLFMDLIIIRLTAVIIQTTDTVLEIRIETPIILTTLAEAMAAIRIG